MNIAEATRMRALEAQVAELTKQVANLKEIVEILTSPPNPLKKAQKVG